MRSSNERKEQVPWSEDSFCSSLLLMLIWTPPTAAQVPTAPPSVPWEHGMVPRPCAGHQSWAPGRICHVRWPSALVTFVLQGASPLKTHFFHSCKESSDGLPVSSESKLQVFWANQLSGARCHGVPSATARGGRRCPEPAVAAGEHPPPCPSLLVVFSRFCPGTHLCSPCPPYPEQLSITIPHFFVLVTYAFGGRFMTTAENWAVLTLACHSGFKPLKNSKRGITAQQKILLHCRLITLLKLLSPPFFRGESKRDTSTHQPHKGAKLLLLRPLDLTPRLQHLQLSSRGKAESLKTWGKYDYMQVQFVFQFPQPRRSPRIKVAGRCCSQSVQPPAQRGRLEMEAAHPFWRYAKNVLVFFNSTPETALMAKSGVSEVATASQQPVFNLFQN